MDDAEGRPRPGRGLRLHPQGQGHHAADGRDADRLRLRRSTPRSATRCIGARVNGRLVPLDHAAHVGRHVEIFTSEGRGRRAVSRTGCSSSRRPGPPTRSASGSPVSGARTPSRPGARSSSRQLRREGLPVQKMPPARSLDEVAAGLELRRPRRALRGHRREPRVGQVGRRPGSASALRGRRPDREEQLPTTVREPRPCGADASRVPACTSRASTTSWCACRGAARRCPATRSWASSPGAAACRCTAPTAPTPCRCQAARATA